MNKSMIIAAVSLTLVGCSGKIYTIRDPQFDDDGKLEGVLYYGYKLVEKKILVDRIRHTKTGEITHSSYEKPGDPRYCRPRFKKVMVTEPDYGTMYAIKYNAAFFETNKFTVELDNGMLKSVNSESTPGPKAAVESLQGLVDIRGTLIGAIDEAETEAQENMANNLTAADGVSMPIACSASE